MSSASLRFLGAIALAASTLSACGDAAITGAADTTAAAGSVAAPTAAAVPAGAPAAVPHLDACPNLAAPAGSRLVARMYAQGVQIYRWNGAAWAFVAPEAVLTADAGGHSTIGHHYAGPTWESLGGSRVIGAVRDRCTPDPSAIAWLLLDATPVDGNGIFRRVSSIQRINTAGGLAPTTAGTSIGDEARVPYTTEYLFYRAGW